MSQASRSPSNASHHRLVADWMAANPFKDFLPLNLIPPTRSLEQPKGDEAMRVADLGVQIDGKLNQSDESNRSKQRTTYKQRRQIEARLADYIEQHMDVLQQVSSLRDAPAKLRACRRTGHWGERVEADRRKLVMGWDFKCGMTRLCPDESRAEQRRLVRRYKPAALAWAREKPTMRRIQKGVVTWPNIEAGKLAPMKREMCRQFAALLKSIPAVKGSLVSQEDPLGSGETWNLHLNVVLLIEGRFDWLELIQRWTAQTRHLFPECDAEHFQIKMRELPRFDEDELDAALREVIKYAVKHQDMTDLDPNRFLEWWNAGLRFRRTRSYGVLFRVGDVKRPQCEIVWYGRVWWEGSLLGGVYAVERPRVFLTQGDNSAGRGGPETTRAGPEPPQRRPLPRMATPLGLGK